MRFAFIATVGLLAVAALATLGGTFLADWNRPPVETLQTGYRGTGMARIANPRQQAALQERNQIPEAYPPAEPGGPPASEIYQNVRVLGDLNEEQFLRVMTAITDWVAPEEGCAYCHAGDNFAADDVYTKTVARHMIEMTRYINSDWTDHVAETGVTCYTCHRGNPVPQEVWFANPGPPQAKGMAGYRGGQNSASASLGNTSLPFDPFTPLFGQGEDIRVEGPTMLPEGYVRSLQDTERTYSLMVHLSESLGVNCTFCHNTRSFAAWDQSTPQRAVAFHGISMVRDLNAAFLEPLAAQLPPERLGPLGDVPKVNCGTCHQGASKPLNGESMLMDYPSLGPQSDRTAAAQAE